MQWTKFAIALCPAFSLFIKIYMHGLRLSKLVEIGYVCWDVQMKEATQCILVGQYLLNIVLTEMFFDDLEWL